MTTTNGYTDDKKQEIILRNHKILDIRIELQSQLTQVVANFKGLVSLDGWQGELEEVFQEVEDDNLEYPYKGVEEVI